jgi:hypothetical protein
MSGAADNRPSYGANCHKDVATDSEPLWTRIRKASRARASDSPVPDEGRSPNSPADEEDQERHADDDASLGYEHLGEVREGDGALAAFLELRGADIEPKRAAALRVALLDYCRHDTRVMVMLRRFCVGRS